jgi:hypothetical protein
MSTRRVPDNLPPLSAWQAQVLRLTAFPSPNAQFANKDWWTKLVRQPPESTSSQPRERLQKEVGSYQNAKLELTVEPLRIDWRYMTEETQQGAMVSDATLGAFPDAVDRFTELMNGWLAFEDVPSLVRLAFGAVLLQPQPDREGPYQLLARYLPFLDLTSSEVSDLVYQINRRRDSNTPIPGLRLNRLGKWSAIQFTTFTVSPITKSVETSEPTHACRLELDVNSAPDFSGEFDRDVLPALFKELVGLAKETASKGDVAP